MSAVLPKFTLKYASVRLYFGPHTVSELERELKGCERILVATGKRSAKESGALDEALSLLAKLGVSYEVFDGVTPNPWASQADSMAQRAWAFGADAILAIGGGSVIDAAKAAAIVAVSGSRAADYVYGRRKAKGWLPVYAVNITHGTGTEVDRYSVLTVEETGEKRGFVSIYPAASVDDPRYTLTLPRNQTVYTALDAFYHAYESATQPGSSPFTEMLSREAARLLRAWLPKAVEEPRDLEARYWLLYASMLAGIAIDLNGTHVIHTIEHVLSAMNPKLAHGCGLDLLGPRAAYYVHKVNPRASAAVLAALDPTMRPVPEDAEKAEKAVYEFQRSVGFEERLGDYGFSENDLPKIAEKSGNPLGLKTPEILDILRHCL